MYQIEYKKRNGEIIKRIRNTLPGKIGETTSMGWIIVDIKYQLNGNYYSFMEYKTKMKKYHSLTLTKNKIKQLIKKYRTTITIIIFVPLYLLK
jgi:hypothetical protein